MTDAKKCLLNLMLIGCCMVTLAACGDSENTPREEDGKTLSELPAAMITDQGKLDMLHGIKNVYNGQLYYMDYTADYKLDELVEQEATDNASLKGFIMSSLLDKVPSAQVKLGYGAGCSAFTAQTPDTGDRIVGRNFDFKHAPLIAAVMVRTSPDNGYKSICMADAYWVGYTQGMYNEDMKTKDLSLAMAFPYLLMDGMNEKGFSISVLHLDGKPTQQIEPGRKSIFTTVLMRYLLDHAGSVDDAIAKMQTFNYHVPDGEGNYHFFLADASGNSAVIEYVYDENHRDPQFGDDEIYDSNRNVIGYRYPMVKPNTIDVMKGKWCASNFYMSDAMAFSEKGPVLSDHGKVRYQMMDFVLTENGGKLSEQKAMNLLDDVSQADKEGDLTSHTQWSVVYNLTQLKANVCVDREYDKVFTFHL